MKDSSKERIVAVERPFHLENAIKTHGWFQLVPYYWNQQQKKLFWATNLDESEIVLELNEIEQTSKKESCEILISSSRPLLPSEWQNAEQKFRHIFNLRLDLRGFYAVCEKYPILSRVTRLGMGRLLRSASLFEDIFKSICGTNIQWKQAAKCINAIAQLGKAVPPSELRIFPGPAAIMEAGEAFLKETGRVGYRSSYLLDLCRRFVAGEPEAAIIENGQMSRLDMQKYFLSFKGVGPATARYLLALYGHFEELAVDSLVISFMTKTHFGGITPTEKQIQDFYQEFGKWRYLAYWMEFILSGGWNPDSN
jgi:3-methyladenine DNA glycosylase/8-oxoguanine DNA glycosylase